jgi:hypothetical protein
VTAGSDGNGSPSASPANNLLGRRPRGATGGASAPVTARAYGSGGAADLSVNSDARGQRAAFPGHGTGGFLTGSNSFFGLRLRRRQAPTAWYNPGGPSGAYGGGWADGSLTVRDRHIMTRYGTVKHSANPANGVSPVNPEADGRPAPQFQMLNRTESWQLGTDHTTQEDNSEPHATVPAVHDPGSVFGSYGREWTGREVFRLGQQDGSQTQVFGPPIGEWREYGVRGGAGMHGPAPDIVDPNLVRVAGAPGSGGTGGGGGRGVITSYGEEGMQGGDKRFVYGGPPHGLHSPTIPSQVFTGARAAAITQQRPPRVDRPASSKIAGQSYSQSVVPESRAGQSGAGNATPRLAPVQAGRQPGIRQRFSGRG